ncbi:MAG: TadE family type IV pilus minor pilin [Bacteroidales bacterium]|nr:TadE family type IV pilus minor pilin [Bacteroidales bacterium]
MTAEVAVTLPVVVLVLAACLGGLGLATAQLRAQDAAADAARLLGRGETIDAAQQHVARTVAGATLVVTRPHDLVCTSVQFEQRVMLVPVVLTASSCALSGGW